MKWLGQNWIFILLVVGAILWMSSGGPNIDPAKGRWWTRKLPLLRYIMVGLTTLRPARTAIDSRRRRNNTPSSRKKVMDNGMDAVEPYPNGAFQ